MRPRVCAAARARRPRGSSTARRSRSHAARDHAAGRRARGRRSRFPPIRRFRSTRTSDSHRRWRASCPRSRPRCRDSTATTRLRRSACPTLPRGGRFPTYRPATPVARPNCTTTRPSIPGSTSLTSRSSLPRVTTSWAWARSVRTRAPTWRSRSPAQPPFSKRSFQPQTGARFKAGSAITSPG